MIKSGLGVALLLALSMNNVAYADSCAKTLMGNDCEANAKGVSSHMRGNAVENAEAAKQLKVAKAKAKAAAQAIAKASN
jgi:hypothetical protein